MFLNYDDLLLFIKFKKNYLISCVNVGETKRMCNAQFVLFSILNYHNII